MNIDFRVKKNRKIYRFHLIKSQRTIEIPEHHIFSRNFGLDPWRKFLYFDVLHST